MTGTMIGFSVVDALVGDSDISVWAELATRALVMYVVALAFVRLTGKRSLGQLSPFDFVIIIALGSAVGDPMLYDDVPIVDAAVVVVVVVALNLIVSWATQRNRTIEKITDSTATVLVRDGAVLDDCLRSENLSLVELREALRLSGCNSMREVRLAVLEPSGRVSILRVDSGEPVDLWSRFLGEHDMAREAT